MVILYYWILTRVQEQKYKNAVLLSLSLTIRIMNFVRLGWSHTDRPFPLHVALNDKTKTQGIVKCEQVKALDVPIRHIQILESMPDELMEEISDILIGCVERNG